MTLDAEFIVIGSGPAGVSAAFPLVEAGRSVVMIDGAGDTPWPVSLDDTALWRQKLAGLSMDDANQSPKLNTPYAQKITAGFAHDCEIAAQDFLAVGAVSRGGLSSLWGGFVTEYDDGDLRDWPISAADLKPHYKAIAERIGVSGSAGDPMSSFFGRSAALEDPPAIGPTAGHVLERMRKHRPDDAFALGLARNALITRDRDGRSGCNLQQHCLWGCDRGAIYDSRFDLKRLLQRPNFRLQDHAFAVKIQQQGGDWEIFLRDGNRLRARKILLAAGCLASTQLAVGAMSDAPKRLRLLSNPVMAMPFLVPARLGKPAPPRGYSLAQLGYRYAYGADYAAGAFYEITGLPAWNFTARLPLSRRGGLILFPFVSPAMLIATCYFPGSLSDNRITWTRSDDRIQLAIQGGHASALSGIAATVCRGLRRHLRAGGAWMLPGATLALPGTDVHYAGTLPMGGREKAGTSVLGELKSAPGIHAVDGAALPSISAKYPTLTIMANAARIGQQLAAGS